LKGKGEKTRRTRGCSGRYSQGHSGGRGGDFEKSGEVARLREKMTHR
jgi:hypothetical protein